MLLRRKGRNRAPLHEHFQFETLRASNIRPVASRKKRIFFRSLRAGRRGAAASRFPFFQRQNAHGARPGGRALPNTFLSHTPIKGATATVLRKRIFARTKNEECPQGGAPRFYRKNSQIILPVVAGKTRLFRSLRAGRRGAAALKKARWGKDGGPGGKDYGNAFPSERLSPLAPAEGFPFPQTTYE